MKNRLICYISILFTGLFSCVQDVKDVEQKTEPENKQEIIVNQHLETVTDTLIHTDSGKMVLSETEPLKFIIEEEEIEEEEIFIVVEDMPRFDTKNAIMFQQYIANRIQYPDIARENGIAGTVHVQFTIDKEGRVIDPRIVRGVDPHLDREAMRVVASSPLWQPGRQRGRPVDVKFIIPVKFVIY